MAYEVVLESFSGPLDLLLHLINKQELSIHDVSIALITDQYMEYINAMEVLSLEIASEFIVMAATLLAIKSRTLLPRPAKVNESEEEEGDPEELLIAQLIEYQRMKEAASTLRELERVQSQVYSRDPLDLRPYAPSGPPPVIGVGLWDLVDAFRRVLRRMPKDTPPAEIRGKVVSVDEMMEVISGSLKVWGHRTFTQLLQFARTRPEVVSTFLAVLELVKAGQAVCAQPTPFAEIDVYWKEGGV